MLQARVAVETRERAQAAAAAIGIPVSEYVQQLVLRDQVDEHGRPMWAEVVDSQQAPMPGLELSA